MGKKKDKYTPFKWKQMLYKLLKKGKGIKMIIYIGNIWARTFQTADI